MLVPVLLLLAATPATPQPVLIRVGSNGAQQNHVGTVIEVATLGDAAGQLARALAGGGSRDVAIELAPGLHRVPAGGLVLGPEHTPSHPEHGVTWRCAVAGTVLGAVRHRGSGLAGGSSCVVHGAEPIVGPWRLCAAGHCAANGTMVAPVPPALKGRRLRHFYLNGRRASRTRSQPSDLFGSPPHFGMRYFGPSFTPGGTAAAVPLDMGGSTANDGVVMGYMVVNETAEQGLFGAFEHNSEDIEMVYPDTGNNWAEPRCAVASVDAKHRKFVMKQPCYWNLYHRPWQPAKGAAPHYVDNVRSQLKQPGQFYYDRAAAEVLYLPRAGEDLSTVCERR
jgi:hypothetical protein